MTVILVIMMADSDFCEDDSDAGEDDSDSGDHNG